jgi:hypothetical protein
MIFTTHHDAPVAFPDSMRVLDATVTRESRGTGRILGPHHRVDVITALKAMTIWAAYQKFEEANMGSLTVGKLADFAILSADPTAVDPGTIDTKGSPLGYTQRRQRPSGQRLMAREVVPADSAHVQVEKSRQIRGAGNPRRCRDLLRGTHLRHPADAAAGTLAQARSRRVGRRGPGQRRLGRLRGGRGRDLPDGPY